MQASNYFRASLKSDHTKLQYEDHLIRFTKYTGVSDSPTDIQIVDYIMQMKEQGLSYSYRNAALYSIKHYCIINDIMLNWPKISKFLGENTVSNEIRGYTRDEIQNLLTVADSKYKAVILTLASTGMRREALVQINPDKDMEYLEDYKLYKIKIYRKSKQEQICFTTPEAADAIKLHMESRKRRYFHDVHPKAVSIHLRNLAIKAGIGQRHPDIEGKIHGQFRDVIPAVHGLRKFCITQMAKAKVDTEIAKLLTGHSIGVRSRYLDYSADDLLNEYMKAINFLTISQENRLKKQVEQLTKEDNEIKALRADFNALKKKMEEL
jgi:integrase